MHEILTVQLGRKANYVGTHFWNAQESYHTFGAEESSPVNHDIHFRQGIAADGSDTYLPRTVLYDLRGGFGSLARLNAVGADIDDGTIDLEDNATWNGPLSRIQTQQPPGPSPYLSSLIAQGPAVLPTPSTTRFFADFASNFYHPRSLVPVVPSDPVLGSSPGPQASSAPPSATIPGFKSYSDGHALFSELNSSIGGEDLYERDLRPWIEECDAMQGLELLTSSDDAWAGFASAYIEDIRDQLGKGSIWVWGLTGLGDGQQSQGRATRLSQTLTQALALSAFNSHASLYIPLMLPSIGRSAASGSILSLDDTILWHTSALASAAIESVTLPTRVRAGVNGRRMPVLGDWEDALGDGGRRRVASLGFQVATAGLGNNELAGAGRDDQNLMVNGHDAASFEANDTRMTNVMQLEDEADEQESADKALPIDLFEPLSTQASTISTSRMSASPPLRLKTFARIDAYRGSEWSVRQLDDYAMEQDLRYLRRGRPVIETFQTEAPLLPLLPTFPHIFTNAPPPNSNRAAVSSGMDAHACLRTSSAIANWVRDLDIIVRRTPAGLLQGALGMSNGAGGPAMEMETLKDELGTMGEAYIEGWDSADEEDIDDLE